MLQPYTSFPSQFNVMPDVSCELTGANKGNAEQMTHAGIVQSCKLTGY